MSLLLPSSSILPASRVNQLKMHVFRFHRNPMFNQSCRTSHSTEAQKVCSTEKSMRFNLENIPPRNFKVSAVECMNSNHELSDEGNNGVTNDWSDQNDEGVDEMGSPWEGAVIYQRNASISHLEYCTTLERLGLGKLSSEVSKSRASLMGLRVTKAVKDFTFGTPVMISVDVTRKKQKLRLDGIIRTVLTLGCNRCGQPAAECVFSNFSLLLTEEPIEEPEMIDMGIIFGDATSIGAEGEEDEALIDWEDRLYFPPEEKTIDISKHIRDMVHLEITINSLCDPMCKGLCLKCGTNLNLSRCSCSKQKAKEKDYGPLADLKEKMQRK